MDLRKTIFAMVFNEATTMESWKTSMPAGPLADDGGFNEATTMESWKTCRCRRGLAGQVDASMRPRRWSRGKPSGHRSAPSPAGRFNEATTMESWKTRSRVRLSPRIWCFNEATTMESWKTAPLADACSIAICGVFRERLARMRQPIARGAERLPHKHLTSKGLRLARGVCGCLFS